MLHTFLKIFVFFIILALPGAERTAAGKSAAEEKPRILFVSSYDVSFKWTDDLLSGFRGYFREHSIPASIEVVELSMARDTPGQWNERDRELLFRQIAAGNYALIIGVHNPAAELLLAGSDRLPDQLPLLISSYQGIPDDLAGRRRNMAGILLADTVKANLELGRKLFPDARTVAIISNSAEDPDALPPEPEGGPELIRLSGARRTTAELMQILRELPQNSFVVFREWYSGPRELHRSFRSLTDQISDNCDVPLLTTFDSGFSAGALGGLMTQAGHHGELTAEQAARILAGEPADRIGLSVDAGRPVFDWRRLSGRQVPGSLLPADSEFRYRPPSFWISRRPELIVAGAGAALILLTLIGFLLNHFRNGRKTRVIFNALPVRVMVCDAQGRIRFSQQREGFLYCRTLNDLPDGLGTIFRVPIDAAFATGEQQHCEYTLEGRRRRAEFTRLPSKVFGVATVLWVSSDIDELHSANELFNAVLDNLPCPFFVKDMSHGNHYRIVNPAYCRLLERDAGDVTGKTDFALYPAETAQKYATTDQQTLHMESSFESIEAFRPRSGEVRFFRVVKRAIHRENGETLLVGVALEITKLAETQRKLRQNNRLLQGMLDNFPALVVAKDAKDDFRHLLWNKKAEEITRIPAAEALGRTDFELRQFEGAADRFHQEDLEVCRTGKVKEIVENLVPSRGGTHRVLRTMKTLIHPGPDSAMLLTLAIDITEQAKLERQQELLHTCLETLIAEVDPDRAIEALLRRLACHLQADHAYIFHYDRHRSECVELYEWTREEMPPRSGLRSYPFQSGRDLLLMLQENRLLSMPDTGEPEWPERLPLAMPEIRRQNIRSLYLNELRVDGKPWGFIGLDYIGRKYAFSESDVTLLSSFSRILEVALLRRRNLDALIASEYEKRQIFDNIDTPIILFDKDFNFIRSNRAADRAYNADKSGGENRPCREIFCKNSEIPENCPVRRTLQSGRPDQIDASIHGRDYIIRTQPLFDREGHLTHVLESAMDVTELNRRQEQLRQAMEAAQAADRAKTEFLATMSHELRTPLNAVIGYSELLQDQTISEQEVRESLKAINFAGNTLLKLINDILDISKLEAGRMEFTPAPTDLGEITGEIIRLFQSDCLRRGIELACDLPGSLPLFRLDQMRLRQLLLNLTGNAIKFTEKGFIRLSVEFQPGPDAGYGRVSIRVADSGIGIAGEFQQSIFEPFNRKRSSTPGNKIYQGTGLGLAISNRMVNRMGGRIELESELGRGSTFTVRFDRVEIVRPAAPTPRPAPALPAELDFRGRVVVVDDVPMNLKVLSAMLRKLGVEYTLCNSGAEALEAIGKEPPAMVLTDVWMPEMSGDQLAERLAADPATASIPVIAITADTQLAPERARCFSGVLYKPVTNMKLRAALELAGRGTVFSESREGGILPVETERGS